MQRFGVELLPVYEASKIIDFSERIEKAKFDELWVTDHYNNRGAFSTLAAIAMKTRKINLGIGVVNPYTRNPAIIASEIATVAELSDYRAMLGIGAGDKATLEAIGIKRRMPLKAVEESFLAISSLLRGEKAEIDGEFLRMNCRLNFKLEKKVKIFIGAQGRRMLELASKLGDGILLNAANEKDVKKALEIVKSREKLSIVASVSAGEDAEKAKQAAKPVVLFISLSAGDEIIERHGINRENLEKIKQSMQKGDFKGALSYVSDDMLEAFCIAGSKKEVRQKIEKLSKLAGAIIFGSPLGYDKLEAIKILSKIKDELKEDSNDIVYPRYI